MPVIFQNPGLIDLRAVTTMGVSVKESESAIGYFGTGLKYAIATILRNGGKISLWIGDVEYQFFTETSAVRGKDFNFVHMRCGGQLDTTPLGFTDQLGKDWQLWMAFRELYSNCLDEAGEMTILHDSFLGGNSGDTSIVVCSSPFEQVANAKDEIFLSSKPIALGVGFEIHRGHSNIIYNKGVRAYDCGKRSSTFTYNFLTGTTLTEDRTIKDIFNLGHRIGMWFVRDCTDEVMLQRVLLSNENMIEWTFDFNWTNASDLFDATMEQLLRRHGSDKIIPSALEAHKRKITDTRSERIITLDEMDRMKFERASMFLEKLGFRPEKINWIFVEELPYGHSIDFDKYERRCKLSMKAMESGAAELVSQMLRVLLENKNKETYDETMSDWLATEYVSLAQKHLKELL